MAIERLIGVNGTGSVEASTFLPSLTTTRHPVSFGLPQSALPPPPPSGTRRGRNTPTADTLWFWVTLTVPNLAGDGQGNSSLFQQRCNVRPAGKPVPSMETNMPVSTSEDGVAVMDIVENSGS